MHRTGRGSRGSVATRAWLLLLLLAAAAAVYFVRLGASSVWDANEAFYVETPREMLQAHDFINPSFNYLPRFNKPVLSYWIVAALYKLFGVSVGVQRVPIAMGALVMIACAWMLAALADPMPDGRWPMADEPRSESSVVDPPSDIARSSAIGHRASPIDRPTANGRRPTDAALWAALGLAASPRLVMWARRIFIDIWISAFMALTLTFFALSEAHPERRRRYLALMYVSVGLGVLTKGPVAIVLPGLAFALYLVVRREIGRVRHMMIPLGIVIVAAIVLPWYVALYHEQGWTYIKSFVVSENIERYTAGVGVRQERGPWFYLPVVLSDSFPWSLLLVPAAIVARRGRTATETLLWCWIAAIVGFFSFSAGKQDLYIFPIVPAVAALGGMAIARARRDERWCVPVNVTLGVGAVLLGLAGAAILYLFATAGRVYALAGASAIGAFGLIGGVCGAVFALRRRPIMAALALVVALVAVDWTFVARVLPDFERYKPVPEMSAVLEQRLHPGDVVAHYQVALPSMVYYLQRHVDQYFDEAPFVRAVLSDARVYAVLSDEDYATLAPQIGARTCIIDRRPTFDVKLKNVLARQPLPELLLITNRCR